MQFIKGQDVDACDARPVELKGTKLVLVNPMLTDELAQGADYDKGTRLEIEDVFTRGVSIVVHHSLQAMELVHGNRHCGLNLGNGTSHFLGWCPTSCSVILFVQQLGFVMLDLGKAQRIDDSLGLHDRIGSFPPVQEIIALHCLRQSNTGHLCQLKSGQGLMLAV
jgi:hypothetical protein